MYIYIIYMPFPQFQVVVCNCSTFLLDWLKVVLNQITACGSGNTSISIAGNLFLNTHKDCQ
jgi:hypothetical protein